MKRASPPGRGRILQTAGGHRFVRFHTGQKEEVLCKLKHFRRYCLSKYNAKTHKKHDYSTKTYKNAQKAANAFSLRHAPRIAAGGYAVSQVSATGVSGCPGI
jgi:hypothetical protein